MIAALYIRVSTDDQLEFSPDAQKKALIEYAKKNGYSITEEHIFVDEGISGTSAKRRPAFMKMIATAKNNPKPFDAILVHKFDRFARSREDSVVYKSLLRKDCGIKVISITEQMEDDKFSVILEAMLEAMAEYYSLNLSDEVMKGMTEKAKKGQVQAIAPFGYKIVDKKYKIVEEQAEIIKLIFNKFVNQGWHCGQISKLINGMGIKNIRGGEWEIRTVKRALRNPVYIGTLRWNYIGRDKNYKTWVKSPDEWIVEENVHEPIIDKELFEKAQDRLNTQRDSFGNKRPASAEIKHYLSGVLRCSSCKGTLIYGKPKNKCAFFQCGSYRRGKCNTSNSISTLKIVREFKQSLLRDIDAINNNEFEKLSLQNKIDNTDINNQLNKRLKEIKEKYIMAKKAYLAKIDTLAEYAKNKQEIQAEENEILNLINNSKQDISHDMKALSYKMQSFIELLDNEDISVKEKNDLLKEFVLAIYIDKSTDTAHIDYIVH